MTFSLALVDESSLQRALQGYSDVDMVHEFSKMLDKCDDNFLRDSSGFVRLIIKVSCGSISEIEILSIYNSCYKNSKVTDKKVLWKYAFSKIRRKILLDFLVSAIIDTRSSLVVNSNIYRSPTSSLRVSSNIDGTIKQHRKDSAQKHTIGGDLPKASDALKSQLEHSLRREQMWRKLVSNSILDLTSEFSLLGRMSASKYFKSQSCLRIYKLMCGMQDTYMRMSWMKWLAMVDSGKLMTKCENFVRFHSLSLIVRYFDDIESRNMRQRFQRLKENLSYLSQVEIYSAAVVIQLFLRSISSNLRCMRLRKENASKRIQKSIRLYFRRKCNSKEEKRLNTIRAVKVISEWWICMRWPRIFARQRYFKKRNMASTTIQSHVRGFVAKKKYQIVAYEKSLDIGALKLQSLYRRFKATMRVREVAQFLESEIFIVRIQCFLRRINASTKVKNFRLLIIAVVKIQVFFRCQLAKSKIFRVKCIKFIGFLQRIYRGYRVRRKLRVKKKVQTQSIFILGAYLLGLRSKFHWQIKKYYLQKLSKFRLILQQKLKAAILGYRVREKLRLTWAAIETLQYFFRMVIERYRILNSTDMIMSRASAYIQKMWRGYAIRRKIDMITAHDVFKSCSLYFQVQSDYLRLQNMLHRSHVVKIQTIYRRRLAYIKISKIRRKRSVRLLESFWLNHLKVNDAKMELKRLKEIRCERLSAAIVIQSSTRGMKCRIQYRKHFRAEEVKWFLEEIHATGLIERALQQFRARKRAITRAYNGAVKIQNRIRGIQCREWFHKNHSRLIRDREKRLRAKKNNCATVLCSKFGRVYLAHRRVEKKRAQLIEHELEKERLADLDASINSMHEVHLNTLYVTRVQSGIRGKLAHKKVQHIALKESGIKIRHADEIQTSSATKIQSIVRGVQYRVIHKRLQPTLKKAKTARSYCTECENRIAKRRCRQCKDNFCEGCYEKIHKKGMLLMIMF